MAAPESKEQELNISFLWGGMLLLGGLVALVAGCIFGPTLMHIFIGFVAGAVIAFLILGSVIVQSH